MKQKGILIASIREIFGENYEDLINSLINIVRNAGEILRTKPEEYINLMVQLSKLVDGQTNNLRGDLFELAVGYYHGQFCKFLEIGKKVRIENDPKPREIDVFANYEQDIHLVECKGYNYAIDDAYVLRYLNEIIPALRKWFLNSSFSDKGLVFEIWSTGGFTEEAITLLEKAKGTKKYKIEYLDKDEILNRAKQLKTSKFAEILREYFFRKSNEVPF